MSEWGILIVLFGAGALLMVAEIFLPSHGILTVAALGFFVFGTVRAYRLGETAGMLAATGTLLAIPAFAYLTIKFWHQTPVGKRISPPNAPHAPEDPSAPAKTLAPLVGQTGKALTTLRPVGTCDFGGKRVSCICRLDMIEAGTAVQAVGITGGNLEVVDASSTPGKA